MASEKKDGNLAAYLGDRVISGGIALYEMGGDLFGYGKDFIKKNQHHIVGAAGGSAIGWSATEALRYLTSEGSQFLHNTYSQMPEINADPQLNWIGLGLGALIGMGIVRDHVANGNRTGQV